jgi:hypothetical protein
MRGERGVILNIVRRERPVAHRGGRAHALLGGLWVGSALIPLVGARLLVSCNRPAEQPPLSGQPYEGGTTGGGGGAGGSGGGGHFVACHCTTEQSSCNVDGFSANATSFALPMIPGAVGSSGAPPFTSLEGTLDCSATETAAWSVLDMNGDLEPDFLLTRACTDVTIGSSRWDLFLGKGTGFSANATSFALPTIAGAVGSSGAPPFTSLDGSLSCSGTETATWSVIDMNGDERPDFLLMRACSDETIGASRWDVYLGNGTGFSANATPFALPTIAGAVGSSGAPPFTSLDGSVACSGTETADWSVLDMNGDDKPDFVVMRACDDALIGTSEWHVYLGTGTGFSANATSFALPTIAGAVGPSGGKPTFTSLGGSMDCSGTGTASWSVIDMNGDERPDFLLTRACADPTIGTTHWDVYLGKGTGFSTSATSFALPSIAGAVESDGEPLFTSLEGSVGCSGTPAAAWSVVDMNGDKRPDFLLTRACTDSTIGNSRWDVYLSHGTGFAASAAAFTLPSLPGVVGTSDKPLLTSTDGSIECSGTGAARWSVIDMNGDGVPDFLLTSTCADSTVSDLDWSVYLARCSP